jgi:uncharacterized small protein (DUF1192 family)
MNDVDKDEIIKSQASQILSLHSEIQRLRAELESARAQKSPPDAATRKEKR